MRVQIVGEIWRFDRWYCLSFWPVMVVRQNHIFGEIDASGHIL